MRINKLAADILPAVGSGSKGGVRSFALPADQRLMHDIVPTWQKISELTADRDFWRRTAEARHLEVHQSTRSAIARLKLQLSELRKQLKRMRRITHCKQCRCMDNPRKAYFAERYEAKKNQGG